MDARGAAITKRGDTMASPGNGVITSLRDNDVLLGRGIGPTHYIGKPPWLEVFGDLRGYDLRSKNTHTFPANHKIWCFYTSF